MLSSIAGITSEIKNIFFLLYLLLSKNAGKLYLEIRKWVAEAWSVSLCGLFFFLQHGLPQRGYQWVLNLSEERFVVLSVAKVCETEQHCESARKCPRDQVITGFKWNYLHVVMRTHLAPCTTYFRFLPSFGGVGEGEKPSIAVVPYADYP